ncbi:MAG: AbrB/MazE/SpoVT family DNA-binding domain-containing protein [Calditrichaeota bacterium]|nr:AbrB/MazE/SpoVT family DNA-binding domain-containing protein [Calditrichota bacterium]
MTKTLTLDSSGRIELPTEIRERVNSIPGSEIRLRETEEGTFVLEVGHKPRDLHGIVKSHGIHLTLEQIEQIIERQGSDE